jgi:glucokinase
MEIVAADIGGTHARFALAEVENGRVVAGRAVHAEDRRARLASDRVAGLRRACRASASQAASLAIASPITSDVIR